jgi:hypothetical protein
MFYDRAPLDFSNHFDSEEFADVKVFVDDGNKDTKGLACHKVILATASEFFRDRFYESLFPPKKCLVQVVSLKFRIIFLLKTTDICLSD